MLAVSGIPWFRRHTGCAIPPDAGSFSPPRMGTVRPSALATSRWHWRRPASLPNTDQWIEVVSAGYAGVAFGAAAAGEGGLDGVLWAMRAVSSRRLCTPTFSKIAFK